MTHKNQQNTHENQKYTVKKETYQDYFCGNHNMSLACFYYINGKLWKFDAHRE